jgi:hypothetical protein
MKRNIIKTTVILFVIALTTISMNAPKFVENNKTEEMLQTECNYSFRMGEGQGLKGCRAVITNVHTTRLKKGGEQYKFDKKGKYRPSGTEIFVYKSREEAEAGRLEAIKMYTAKGCKIFEEEVKDKCK